LIQNYAEIHAVSDPSLINSHRIDLKPVTSESFRKRLWKGNFQVWHKALEMEFYTEITKNTHEFIELYLHYLA